MLVKIDIDCHRSGTLDGAKAFARWLSEKHFPGLYWEVSTNGNGVHGYFVLEKEGFEAVEVNHALRKLEYRLRQLLARTSFGVEDVEIKGLCTEIAWQQGIRRIATIKSGSLAKIPRDFHRFEEWKATTRLTMATLNALPDRPQNSRPARRAISEFPTRRSGSESGCVIPVEEIEKLATTYRSVARNLLPAALSTTGGAATQQDMAIFLMLLRFFEEKPNADGSLPTKRIEKLWKALVRVGDVERSHQAARIASLRNHLSALNLIDWTSNTYTPGCVDVSNVYQKGKACKWKIGNKLLSLIETAEQEEKRKNKENQAQEINLSQPFSTGKKEYAGIITSLALSNSDCVSGSSLSRTREEVIRPVLIPWERQWLYSPDEIMEIIPAYEGDWQLAA